MAEVAQLDWPIRVRGSDYVEVEQDTTQDAGASVAVLCCFERGSRHEDPDFGITDPTFSQEPVDTTEIVTQSAIYVSNANVDPVVLEDGTVRVNVSVHNPDDEDT